MSGIKREKIDIQLIIFCILILVVSLFVVKGFTHEPSTGKYMVYVFGFTLIFIFKFLSKEELKFKLSIVHMAFFGFAIACFFSLIPLSMDNPQYLPYSIDLSFYILFLAVTAVWMSNKLNTKTKIEVVMLFFVISGLIITVNGLLNYYFGWDIFLGETGSKLVRTAMRSTIGNPNFVADYIGLVLPLIIYFILSPNIFKGAFNDSKIFYLVVKIFMVLSLPIMIPSIFVAGSRTVMTGIFVGIILFILLYVFYFFKFKKNIDKKSFRYKSNLVFILISVFLIVLVLGLIFIGGDSSNINVDVLNSRFENLVSSSNSWDNRISAWKNSIYQLLDEEDRARIVFGTGIGTFQLYHLIYTGQVQADNPDYAAVWSNFKRTHNDYIQGLGETGILGFVFICILMVSMLVIYIKNLFKLKDLDKVTMYLALGAAIFSISLHTLFEFPLHMQPNQMATIFIFAIAMGPYFNPGQKERVINKRFVFYIPAFILCGILVYTKTIAYLGEGFFRQGQINQTFYIQVESELAKNDESVIKGRIEDLENLEGDYSYLKDLNSFLAIRESNLRSENPNLPELEFIKVAENARTSEITKIYNELNNVLNQINVLDGRASGYYENALNKFIDSNSIYPVYGKPLWYLAGMATKQERFEKINSSNDYAIEVLKGEDHLSSRIVNEFEGNLNIIPLPERDLRDLPFKDFVTENENDLFDSQYANVLNIKYLAQIQCMYDAADYYESSMITFSERQTPRIVAKIYKSIYDELNKYINYISNYKDQLNDSYESFEELEGELNSRVVEAAEMVEYWYETAITILPAGRQVNDDWENIYYEYATVLNSLNYYSAEEMKDKLVHIAEKKAKASFGMNSLLIDVPNELMSYAINYNKELPSDQRIEYVKKIIEIFKPVYSSLKEKYTNEKGNENERTQMKIFIDNYESIAPQVGVDL